MATIRVYGDGFALAGVRASAQLKGRVSEIGVSDDRGEFHWQPSAEDIPSIVLLEPPTAYWQDTVTIERMDAVEEVVLEPLPRRGPRGWWHASVGRSAGMATAGKSIRIGIVDSGFGPCPGLAHVVSVGAWIGGNRIDHPAAGEDASYHGTHVTGLVAARVIGDGDYAGISPGVEAFVARVFSRNVGHAESEDIANAVEHLVDQREVHLINLSLGAPLPSEVERQAMADAEEKGVLVFAAAGNSGGELAYPAAYDETVAVSAVGSNDEGSPLARRGGYRLDSREAAERKSDFYFPAFSSRGTGVACCAPGVEIISTAPTKDQRTPAFAAMSGTSMSSPIACAALAIRLATDEHFLALPPTRSRTEYARRALLDSCRRIGLEENQEGAGLVTSP